MTDGAGKRWIDNTDYFPKSDRPGTGYMVNGELLILDDDMDIELKKQVLNYIEWDNDLRKIMPNARVWVGLDRNIHVGEYHAVCMNLIKRFK